MGETFRSVRHRSEPWYHAISRKVRVWVLVGLVAGPAAACDRGPEPAPGADRALTDTLTRLVTEAYDFTRPDVAERMAALYPESGRVVSTSGGQLVTSADSVRAGILDFWENVGQNMQNPTWQWDSVYVDRLSADAAVLTGSWSIPHVAPNDQPHIIRGVWTAVFRRLNGRWQIVQEHLSSR